MTIVAALALPTVVQAELNIDVNQGNIEPLPIAVPDFIAQSPQAQKVAIDISTVIAEDLERSGLFAPIDKRAFLSRPAGLAVRPNFVNWKPLNAQALIVGEAKLSADGQLSTDFRLWDVFAEQPMTGLSLSTSPANWRRVAFVAARHACEALLIPSDALIDDRCQVLDWQVLGKVKHEENVRAHLVRGGGAQEALAKSGPAVLGDGIDPLVGALVLLDLARFDQALGQKRVQGRVDRPEARGVNVREGTFLERLFDFVAAGFGLTENT